MQLNGYYVVMLPDYQSWQGFNLVQLDAGRFLLDVISPNIQNLQFDPANCVSIHSNLEHLHLSPHDMSLLTILTSMLVHDAHLFSLTGITMAADAIHRVTGLEYFWVKGRLIGDSIESEIGYLDASSIEEAEIAACHLALEEGFPMLPNEFPLDWSQSCSSCSS